MPAYAPDSVPLPVVPKHGFLIDMDGVVYRGSELIPGADRFVRQLLDRQLIDAYRPDAAAAEERGRWQLEYIARLLRVLQQEVEAMQRNSP